MSDMERLQKIIAAAGMGSRRKAEAWIQEGRVTVNGTIVRKLGSKADPARDHIRVDGKLIRHLASRCYILLNKPRRVICTVSDPRGRTKVIDLVHAKGRLYPVGRLDYDTEGLIILTNDGEFTRIISKAGDRIPKVYLAKVRGVLDESGMRRLRSGMRLGNGSRVAPARVTPIREGNNSWYQVTLTEGKNQQIRRMFRAVGHPVMKLRRTAIGFLRDERLLPGQYRSLTALEVDRFLQLGEPIGSLRGERVDA